MTIDSPPPEVVRAFGLERATFEPIDVGLINRTFRVLVDGRPTLVLQRQHHAFRGEVNLDIEAICAHLVSRGIAVPCLVRTPDGRAWVEHEGRPWRALEHLDGVTISRVEEPSLARTAAELVGRFHAAIDGFEHTFHFTRPGAHDTAAHLARLEAALGLHAGHPAIEEVRPVAEAILSYQLPKVPATKARIIHGDLKISNVLFAPDLSRAVALLDLDTFQHGTLAIELGDALRSWCNPAGESAESVKVDEAIFRATIEGYASTAHDLLGRDENGRGEIESIVPGLETIALELSSRFALDALEDRYFAWDATRFPSRTAHDLVRARSQLALARSAATQRPALQRIVDRAFT
ncbi:MAG: phosphotransferase [Deltaproteobacteria bacterium]|nr:phosphotransferase [Deltaproteobacteria bacterium]